MIVCVCVFTYLSPLQVMLTITVRRIYIQVADQRSHCPLRVCIGGTTQQPWEAGQLRYPKITGGETEAPTVPVTRAGPKPGTGARKQMYL